MIDYPLMSGDVDGEETYHGYPFLASGSTGYPDAGTVLRSYLKHEVLDVVFIGDDLDTVGTIVLDEPDPERDELCFQVRKTQGVMFTGIDYYREAASAATATADRLNLPEPEALDGELLYRIGNVLEADIIITDRTWLLKKRDTSNSKHLKSVTSIEEGLALIGLYLRWHNLPVIIGGAAAPWSTTSMRRSAAFATLPAFERWNQAGRKWCDTNNDSTLDTLNQSCLTRVSRALKFRDNVYGLSATMQAHEPEEMLCELDALLYSLVGAFDVAARIVDLILRLRSSGTYSWQSSNWRQGLETAAPELHAFTAPGSDMQTMFKIVRWLRNTVHYEALDLTRDSQNGYLVTIPDDAQDRLRDILRSGSNDWTTKSLNIHVRERTGATASKWLPGMGRYTVHVTREGAPKDPDPLAGQLMIDIRGFLNKVFPSALESLNEIIARTPLLAIPGYTQGMESPVRVNLPWQFSDTTAHRLRLIFGLP